MVMSDAKTAFEHTSFVHKRAEVLNELIAGVKRWMGGEAGPLIVAQNQEKASAQADSGGLLISALEYLKTPQIGEKSFFQGEGVPGAARRGSLRSSIFAKNLIEPFFDFEMPLSFFLPYPQDPQDNALFCARIVVEAVENDIPASQKIIGARIRSLNVFPDLEEAPLLTRQVGILSKKMEAEAYLQIFAATYQDACASLKADLGISLPRIKPASILAATRRFSN
jgi:hypothetical protein